MSYEGYEVHYCENGHKVGEYDANDPRIGMFREDSYPVPKCGVCESTKIHVDFVDQTNGCYGAEDTEDGSSPEGCTCPYHETVRNKIGFTMVKCGKCEGKGMIKIGCNYVSSVCRCEGRNPLCESCFGTGLKYIPMNNMLVDCPDCYCRGQIAVPIWDISVLKNRNRE